MAVQGNVFENGRWVTRTLDPRELLGPTSSTPRSRLQPPEPPSYGILTKTVIASPVIRWVLPVQLRSSRNNDVAFIGDSFVQICELGRENQLQNVLRKHDFGSHIRNARVLGSPAHTSSNQEHDEPRWQTPGDDDVEMGGSAPSANAACRPLAELPPQLLVLVLERGALVFLHIETTAQGGLEFCVSSHEIPNADWDHPGFQMTVDPSSRYLALACPEDLFVVYELESMDTLRAQHHHRQPLSPVKSFRARAIRGVIYKLEFLFPAPDDDYHIILMMIVIRDKVARLATYDWELGEPLERVFREDKRGYKLDEQWSMPLLVVPLTVQSSFMMITETLSALVYNMPHGPPDYQTFSLQEEMSEYHFSSALPLWTAWARPRRDSSFHRESDVIYLAREDGIFTILETSSQLETSTLMGSVKCNIDTAFACLYDPHYDPHGDILVTGGDCGPGAIWSVKPKQTPRQISTIPNWSPTVDLATTYSHPRDSSRGKPKRRGDTAATAPLRPDQIFACSGRGKSGAITEFRYGLDANIGTEMDFEVPIKQCWEIPIAGRPVDEGLHLLVSSPNRSDVVFISDDFGQAEVLQQEQVPYDLSSSTLACGTAEETVIQVTSSAITVVTTADHTRHLPHEFYGPVPATIAHAAIRNNIVGMVLHSDSQCHLKTLFVHGINTTSGILCEVKGDVTCVALVKFGDAMAMVAGVWRDERPILLICPVAGEDIGEPLELDSFRDENQIGSEFPANLPTQLIEPLTSIVVVEETGEGSSIVVGTRSGDVFTLALHPNAPHRYRISHEKYGPSAADVFPFSTSAQPRSAFICCNSNLAIMRHYSSHGEQPLFEERFRVVPTSVGRPDMAIPPINAVTRLRRNLSSKPDCISVVLVSGSMIYIAELDTQPRPVLRQFPLGRKPVKVAYSHRLGVLMVLVCDEFDGNRPALLFIDPETGDDLSLPTHNNGNELDYISGLGEHDTNVFSLTTWRYQKGGTDWEFLVISMETAQRRGQVLVISASEDESMLSTHGRPKIRFCTKWKKSHYAQPIRSVATDSQGLFLCSGTTIYYEVIDMVEKKLRVAKQHALSSVASWMEVVDDKLHVVTIRHSLEIFDYKSDPEDETMTKLYNDPNAKNGLHGLQAGDKQLTLLSDVHRRVHGLWIPPQDASRLRTIFSAELPVSVRRFGRCKARQPWETLNGRPQYGRAGTDTDACDIIGLAIDGSLQQFTLLSNEAWQLLSFLQQLALESKKICPFGQHSLLDEDDDVGWNPLPPQSERHPKRKHVDGDILQRCLDSRALDWLLEQHTDRYRELLQGLEQGKYTESLGSAEASGKDPYIALGYTILRYYLAPIL